MPHWPFTYVVTCAGLLGPASRHCCIVDLFVGTHERHHGQRPCPPLQKNFTDRSSLGYNGGGQPTARCSLGRSMM